MAFLHTLQTEGLLWVLFAVSTDKVHVGSARPCNKLIGLNKYCNCGIIRVQPLYSYPGFLRFSHSWTKMRQSQMWEDLCQYTLGALNMPIQSEAILRWLDSDSILLKTASDSIRVPNVCSQRFSRFQSYPMLVHNQENLWDSGYSDHFSEIKFLQQSLLGSQTTWCEHEGVNEFSSHEGRDF